MRRTVTEVLARLLLLGAALTTLRFAESTYDRWQKRISATFDFAGAWDIWLGAMALLALAGLLVGLASLPDVPRGYRWVMPLVITVPALLLLAHFVLVYGNTNPGKTDLPWILDHITFYMGATSQFVIAVVAGFGIAAGLRPRRANEP